MSTSGLPNTFNNFQTQRNYLKVDTNTYQHTPEHTVHKKSTQEKRAT